MGPVLTRELVRGSRTSWLFFVRWLFAAFIAFQFLTVYAGAWTQNAIIDHRTQTVAYVLVDPQASVTRSHALVWMLTWQQYLVFLLITPGFVAGQVTDEKTRGTLQHLLTTHLSPWEIVLGKLLGQGAVLASATAVALPPVVFAATVGDVPLPAVVAQQAALALLVFALGAIALLASVWSRNTSEAMLVVYGGLVVALLLPAARDALAAAPGPLPRAAAFLDANILPALEPFGPTYLLDALDARDPSAELGQRCLATLASLGGVGLFCFAVAAWRLRPAYMRQMEARARRRRPGSADERGPVGDEPVRWREEQVEGIAPLSGLRRLPQWVGVAATGLLTAALLVRAYPQRGGMSRWGGVDEFDLLGFYALTGLIVSVAFGLVVAVRSSAAISREREQRTWEALLLTALLTREVVRQKYDGIRAAVLPYLVACGIAAGIVAILHGPVDVLFAVTWLAGAWLQASHAASSGLWCSAQAKSSWRSLLNTLLLSFTVGLLYAMTVPLFVSLAFSPFFAHRAGYPLDPGGLFCSAMALVMAALFAWLWWIGTRANLEGAVTFVLREERTWRVPEGLVRDVGLPKR